MSEKSIAAIRSRELAKRQPVVPAGATKKQAKKFEQLDQSLAAEQADVNAEATKVPKPKTMENAKPE
jgi:hypothetical protein